MAPLNPDRLHSLDALRGIMMLLGIVLHAAIAYSTMPTDSFTWYLHDQQRHPAFDVLIIFIHSFRIPLFFLLSGFFTHLVLTRKGHLHFVRSRIRRILVPFVLAFLVLTPVVDASFVLAIALPEAGPDSALAQGRSHVFSWEPYGDFHLMHLWFLYYLMLIYGVVLCALHMVPRLFGTGASQGFVRGLLLPVLALSPGLLYFMESGSIDTPLHFFPVDPAVLLFYLMWFLVGWKLFANPHFIAEVRRKSSVLLCLAVIPLLGHLLVLDAFYSTAGAVPAAVHLLNAILAGMVITCFCFGILGAFARLFPAPNRIIGFLGDASYWTYLVHLPVVVLVAGLFQLTSISAFLKYPLVVAISSILLVASYLIVAPLYRLFAQRPFTLSGFYRAHSRSRIPKTF